MEGNETEAEMNLGPAHATPVSFIALRMNDSACDQRELQLCLIIYVLTFGIAATS